MFGQDPQQVTEVAELRKLLDRKAGGVIFATIQKFRPEDGDFDVLTARRDVVVFVDVPVVPPPVRKVPVGSAFYASLQTLQGMAGKILPTRHLSEGDFETMTENDPSQKDEADLYKAQMLEIYDSAAQLAIARSTNASNSAGEISGTYANFIEVFRDKGRGSPLELNSPTAGPLGGIGNRDVVNIEELGARRKIGSCHG